VRPPALAPLLVALLAFAPSARAEEPAVSGVETSFAGRELRVAARLDPDLPEELVRRLASGLPATVTWRVGLFA
jgi:hypothetical protein